MTERALRCLQRKVAKDKVILNPGIFISSHSAKIGCREVGGSWISIQIRDRKEISDEFKQIGICSNYRIFSDKESLLYLHEFSKLTFDLAQEDSSKIIFRELEGT
jgi:hypothetical protein